MKSIMIKWLKKYRVFPWKEYLGLCLITGICGVIYSSNALRELPSESTLEFFRKNLVPIQNSTRKLSAKLIRRFPNLTHAHTQDQALVAIAFISAGLREEATSILEGMVELQNNDGSWSHWYANTQSPGSKIKTSSIAWMVIAFNHYRERFQSERFIAASESAIRYLIHFDKKTHAFEDLPVIASALYHFHTRIELGSTPYRGEAIRMKSMFVGTEPNPQEPFTNAMVRLGNLKPTPDDKLKLRSWIENSCHAQLNIPTRGLASEGSSKKTLLNENTWPLILAAEIDGFNCFGQKPSALYKIWISENEDIKLIGNLTEIAWAYFAKNKINPLVL